MGIAGGLIGIKPKRPASRKTPAHFYGALGCRPRILFLSASISERSVFLPVCWPGPTGKNAAGKSRRRKSPIEARRSGRMGAQLGGEERDAAGQRVGGFLGVQPGAKAVPNPAIDHQLG